MFYISYGSVCELETQTLLDGDLGFIEKGHNRNRKNAKSADKISRKQTLESLLAVSVAGLTPGILGPSSPTKLEKNFI
jgi:hypothetical protein